ncbi:MAG TPA: site-specific DNA-methyltransferase [Desulfuromonadales bacterium]|nr:site-specific DNA-methyltransferase [Desulfuromonadales bacterium]
MSDNLNKLKAILREMFQLDQADLDFGIYRIMNQKRDEIEQFLDRDLLPQVKTVFAGFQGDDQSSVRDEMDKLKKTLEDAGVVAETSPKYQALQAKLSSSVDVSALENEVFSQLTNFFRRYYNGGDFLSLRRYKAGVYAIPYEGEEVKLHWANADQYYIKSSENFRDYTFKLPSGKRAHFKLVDASTEQNNKKEQAGAERRFYLSDGETRGQGDGGRFIEEKDGEIYIYFQYAPHPENKKQSQLNTETIEAVRAFFSQSPSHPFPQSAFQPAPTEKNTKRTLLEKHLNDYTAKYSFDYFIHKDLGGFMRRELDFFIKNEILFIDDLDADHVKATISKVKVIKEIGHKVIAFLEQLENFQKKLWLKKKFVVETGYCSTLDKVPEELYPAIIDNAAQLEEWKRLFTIQDIEGDLHTPKYTDPLTVAFLKANPFLVIDTAFFDCEFTEKLLASFDNLDEATNGLLVHSENFQALNLLVERFRGQVKCTYIDPPYNTGDDGFPYKDNYQYSSWLSMLDSRITISRELLSSEGLFFLQIGDDEAGRSRILVENIFPERKNSVVVRRGVKNVQAQFNDIDKLNLGHDVIHVCANKAGTRLPHLRQKLEAEKAGKFDTFWRGTDRGTMRYELFGQTPSTGQWRWEKGRATKAKDDYIYYLQNESENKSLDDWYVENLQAGTDLDFVRLNEENVVQYYVPPQGHKLVSDNWLDVTSTGSLTDFPHEKGLALLHRVISWNTAPNDYILDFFAGSGSVGHAAFSFPLGHSQSRRYILIEMGEYFDTTLKPRLKKYIYSKEYINDKPVSRKGSSHMFKYIRLESYEDALNNLQLKRTPEQGSLLEQHDKLREQYMLSYMLDVESAGSTSLLNVSAFADPFNYRMNIARGNETKETVVDLVETFNWLLGIKVLRISQKDCRTADFERDGEGRLQIVKGSMRKANPPQPPFIKGGAENQSSDNFHCNQGVKSPLIKGDLGGFAFQEVEGQTLSGDKVLIIWRTLTDNPEQDNLMLDAWFGKRNYNTLDFEFSRIYVNGDNNLENLKIGEERWKVALIEQEFKKLMFDVEV